MKTDPKTESEVIAILNRFAEAYKKRDIDALMTLFAPDPDVILIGTGPDEKCIGLKEIRDQAERDWSQVEEVSLEFFWHSVSGNGPVAWATTEGAAHVKNGDQKMTLPLRWTVVLEKREDRWLITQSHGSLPVSGEMGDEPSPGEQ